MTATQPKDIGASVRARLLHLARTRGEDFQLLLTRYVNERLLYRLAASDYATQFVVKGATLFTAWTGNAHRATRDIDLLGFGSSAEDDLLRIFASVLATSVPDDGVRFDAASLSIGAIREGQEYGGHRIEMIARITSAQVRVQVDIGFGDAITPNALELNFPTVLDFPAPRLRAYPRETVVAEKLDAMVQLGIANTRMKDFYDLALLARGFEFEGSVLVRAIRNTFERRRTQLPSELPVALTDVFSTDASKRSQWSGFVRKAGVQNGETLEATVARIRSFVEAPLACARSGASMETHWLAGGPWR